MTNDDQPGNSATFWMILAFMVMIILWMKSNNIS